MCYTPDVRNITSHTPFLSALLRSGGHKKAVFQLRTPAKSAISPDQSPHSHERMCETLAMTQGHGPFKRLSWPLKPAPRKGFKKTRESLDIPEKGCKIRRGGYSIIIRHSQALERDTPTPGPSQGAFIRTLVTLGRVFAFFSGPPQARPGKAYRRSPQARRGRRADASPGQAIQPSRLPLEALRTGRRTPGQSPYS
jgi:hypothetical protein